MKKIVISILLVLGISLLIFSKKTFQKEKISSTQNAKIITEQILENTNHDIEVKFPQFYGLTENSDKIINDIIKDGIYDFIEVKKSDMILYNLYLRLDYKIEYLNDNFISIAYSGIWIPATDNIGFRGGDEFYTINIDIMQGKVIQLNDFLVDTNKIYDLLEQDKFECINPPENIKENGLFSRYSNTSRNMIKEEISSDITKESNQRRVQWYVTGNALVLCISENRYLHKYSVSLDEVKEFLNADIMSKIKDLEPTAAKLTIK